MVEANRISRTVSVTGALMFAATLAVSGCGADDRGRATYDDIDGTRATAARPEISESATGDTDNYPGADADGENARWGIADDPETAGQGRGQRRDERRAEER